MDQNAITMDNSETKDRDSSKIEIDLRSEICVLVNFPISLLNAAGLEGLTA